jgi:hypothetical protein
MKEGQRIGKNELKIGRKQNYGSANQTSENFFLNTNMYTHLKRKSLSNKSSLFLAAKKITIAAKLP